MDLPPWLEYDPETNELRSIGPVPSTKFTELFVQAKGDAHLTLEQFTLRIIQPTLTAAETVQGANGDVEMQTVQLGS